MPIKRTLCDPGTADAGPYWPWRVTPHSDASNRVKVRPGEVWSAPTMEAGYCLPEIRGLMLPFTVFPTSFIYLQVWLNIMGKPIWASICHTSMDDRHFGEKDSVATNDDGDKMSPNNWLVPGEKWLNWPKLYALDRYVPYAGPDNQHFGHERVTKKGGTLGAGGFYGAGNLPAHPPVVGSEKNKNEQSREQGGGQINTWLKNKEETILGAIPHISKLTCPTTIRDNTRTVNVLAAPGTGPTTPLDCPANQIYQGINRELRKEIGAHRDAGFSLTPEDPEPNNVKRAKRTNEQCCPATSVEGMRGGFYNPGFEYVYQPVDYDGWSPPVGTASIGKSATNFFHGWRFIKENCFRGGDGNPIWQRQWSESRQFMAFYPIAYAVRNTRDDSNFFDGIEIDGVETVRGKSKQVKFKMIQAAKTHLYLADCVEGDDRLKILQPYQGMGSWTAHNSWGDGTNTFPEFRQSYEYSMSSDIRYRRVSAELAGGYPFTERDWDAGEGGKWHYKSWDGGKFYTCSGGEDFAPYSQYYLDKMYNQHKGA